MMLIQLMHPTLPKPAERNLGIHEKAALIKEKRGPHLLEERMKIGLTQPRDLPPASTSKRSTPYSGAHLRSEEGEDALETST
jgi:hypothetical protein